MLSRRQVCCCGYCLHALAHLQTAAESSANGNLPSTVLPEQVRLSEILVSTPQPYVTAQIAEARHKAEDVRDAIRRGGAFADLARANSQGPTAAQGGDMGYFTHGNLARSLEELVFSMKVGDVSDVLQTKQGFVILEVTDHRRPGDLPVEVLNLQVTPELRVYLEELIKKVRQHWYAIIPYFARAPQRGNGAALRSSFWFSVTEIAIAEEKVASSSGRSCAGQSCLGCYYPGKSVLTTAEHDENGPSRSALSLPIQPSQNHWFALTQAGYKRAKTELSRLIVKTSRLHSNPPQNV